MNILIVNDHYLLRSGVQQLATKLFPEATILEQATMEGLLAAVTATSPDLMITAATLNGKQILPMLPVIQQINPNLKIICLADVEAAVGYERLVAAGVTGLISTQAAEATLAHCFSECAAGRSWIDHGLKHAITTISAPEPHRFDCLSSREFGIMQELVKGRRVGEIAHANNICLNTVSTHKKRIFKKMKINSVVELSWLYKDSLTANAG